jgi:hypothetical protein
VCGNPYCRGCSNTGRNVDPDLGKNVEEGVRADLNGNGK